ncbi:MAG: ABC transporter permease [Erysipelotrichaceae bacterium]|nr:ABC transporter permease [Erysipelotrichaceae bacterium]
MSENNKYDVEKNVNVEENDKYSLNDDRRVKVLSPGAMVAKRFFRNRIAVVGLTVLVIMFIFSFIGGVISPYGENQFFYRYETRLKEIAGAKENTDYRYLIKDADAFTPLVQATSTLNIKSHATEFQIAGSRAVYTIEETAEGLYLIRIEGREIGAITKSILSLDSGTADYELNYNALKAHLGDQKTFTIDGVSYEVDETGGLSREGTEIGYVSEYVVSPIGAVTDFTRDFKEELQYFLESNDEAGHFIRDGQNEKVQFTYKNPESGEDEIYVVAYNAADSRWVIKRYQEEHVYDLYSAPNDEHWLGTDGYGMDMLTRLMYGGRVSLVIGFIVVIIETGLGIVLGGISGYFGGAVDFLIMRIVDIMFCIPSTPILIIIGAAMDALGVDPSIRMLYLMLILGFLGWPGIAHMVRGQILSLREQEFMTAAEATGLSAKRRIFKHLIPNVIPQLIVSATMGLGSAILTEATLSFLGLGVRFPFASWGNIINGVKDTYVLTNYWWVWIPAGCCILATVLAFNLVGDGLRDAFDPKMKR